MITSSCQLSTADSQKNTILLAHGSGGRLTHELIRELFYPAFSNELLDQDHDGCVFDVEAGRMAVTTDSFVVDPVFFPGGNIGDLAINGTVNDLACCGATPCYLTAGFILEEGLPMADLRRIVWSMRKAADRAGVRIIAGDTKVVGRGTCDKLFINTSGVGVVPGDVRISPALTRPGDAVLCSGMIGDHGIAILSARESLGFETSLKSDTRPLNRLAARLIEEIGEIHTLRDATRGGVGTTLNEIARSAGVTFVLDETQLPVSGAVRAASEMLGLDPLYIANEGVMLVTLPGRYAGEALRLMQELPEGRQAACIGHVEAGPATVRLRTPYGGSRMVDMLSGEQLPRIC